MLSFCGVLLVGFKMNNRLTRKVPTRNRRKPMFGEELRQLASGVDLNAPPGSNAWKRANGLPVVYEDAWWERRTPTYPKSFRLKRK